MIFFMAFSQQIWDQLDLFDVNSLQLQQWIGKIDAQHAMPDPQMDFSLRASMHLIHNNEWSLFQFEPQVKLAFAYQELHVWLLVMR